MEDRVEMCKYTPSLRKIMIRDENGKYVHNVQCEKCGHKPGARFRIRMFGRNCLPISLFILMYF